MIIVTGTKGGFKQKLTSHKSHHLKRNVTGNPPDPVPLAFPENSNPDPVKTESLPTPDSFPTSWS